MPLLVAERIPLQLTVIIRMRIEFQTRNRDYDGFLPPTSYQ